MVKKRETKESSEAPSTDTQKVKKPSKKRKLENETSIFQLRPITILWLSQYMKALLSCSKPYESQNWFNVRVLGNPPQNALEVVIQIFEENLIHIKEIVALDLGWSRGEWMIKLKDTQSLLNLNSKTSLNYSRGYFMGDYQSKDSNPIQREKGLEEDKVSPKIEFIITSIFELFSNQQNEIQSVEIPIVLMGIPFHESNDKIDLNNYLFESITAQNKDLGIKSVTIKQRYKVGSAQTNDVLCHMKIDQSLIHRWDLEKTMKVTIQGWDNDGVPRPEMWPVTMRYLDECLTCGGFYHLAEDGLSTVDCDTITVRNDLINRREAFDRKQKKIANGEQMEKESDPIDLKSGIRTSIGFIVAT